MWGTETGRSRWWCNSVSLSRTKQKPALKGEIMGTLTEVSFFLPFSLPPSQSSMNTCSVTDTSIGTEGQNPQLVSNWWKQTTRRFIKNCQRVWSALWMPSVYRSGVINLAWVEERELGEACRGRCPCSVWKVEGLSQRKNRSTFQGLQP